MGCIGPTWVEPGGGRDEYGPYRHLKYRIGNGAETLNGLGFRGRLNVLDQVAVLQQRARHHRIEFDALLGQLDTILLHHGQQVVFSSRRRRPSCDNRIT